MRHLTIALLLVLAAATAPAQSLADCIPADTLAYVEGSGTYDEWSEGLGAGTLWENPVDPRVFMEQMSQALGYLEKSLGVEAGTLGSWLTSIRGIQAALLSLEPTGGVPELDFVVVVEHPQAEQIYEVLSGKIAKRFQGIVDDEGDLEIPVDEMALNVGRRGERLIFAGDPRRLRATARDLGSVKPDSLAKCAAYKAVKGDGEAQSLFYIGIPRFREMLEQRVPAGSGYNRVSRLLGLRSLQALGWAESRTATRMALFCSASNPLLETFSGPPGPPDLLRGMPAGTAFAACFTGNLLEVWKTGAARALNPEINPMAPLVEARIVALQQSLGMTIEEALGLAANGVALGILPDENGRLDEEENVFILARLADPQAGADMVAGMAATAAKELGRELETETAAGVTSHRLVPDSSWRETMHIVVEGSSVMIGFHDRTIQALRDVRNEGRPSLGSTGRLKGLPQQAQGYIYMAIKPFMATERELTAGYGRVSDKARIAAAVHIQGDRLICETAEPLSQAFASFGMAAGFYESGRAQRRVHMQNLERIGEAYDKFMADNDRPPRTLSELGFSGKTALEGPEVDGVRKKGVDLYELLPPTPSLDERRDIIAYCKDSTAGRLVLNRAGDARTMSETRFRRALARKESK